MLALTRKKNESIMLNGNIEIKVLEVQGDKVKLGIVAPKEVSIYREEIYRAIQESNKNSSLPAEIKLDDIDGLFGR